jgi:hypothetical protein
VCHSWRLTRARCAGAAPLRKALNDSGLGEAIIGGGLGDELRQPVFSLGLKGVKPEDAEKARAARCSCSAATMRLQDHPACLPGACRRLAHLLHRFKNLEQVMPHGWMGGKLNSDAKTYHSH